VLSPDAAFQAVSNAAAAAFAREPATVAYRVRVAIDRVASASTASSAVVLRTADGIALVRPLPAQETASSASAPARSGAPPALPIVLDALAEWAFHLDDTGPDARLRVAYDHPRAFRSELPEAGVDVTVTSLRGYAVAYVAGEPTHLRLAPATPEMRAYAAGADDFVFREVVFDAATLLPIRVVLAAPGETLTLDYTVTAGAWLLARAVDEDRSRTHARAALRRLDAVYDGVTLPPETGSGPF